MISLFEAVKSGRVEGTDFRSNHPFFKTITWKEYVFSWMSNPTYVISLSPQAKWYVLIWLKYLIPLTCLKFSGSKFKLIFSENSLVTRLTIIQYVKFVSSLLSCDVPSAHQHFMPFIVHYIARNWTGMIIKPNVLAPSEILFTNTL